MSKSTKVLLLLLCVGAASSAVRAGALAWISAADSIVILGTIVAVSLMIAFTWIHPIASPADAPIQIGMFRKALIAIVLVGPVALVALERPDISGFLPIAVLLLSAPVALVAPMKLKASLWLVLYGVLGLVAYSVSSTPQATASAAVRVVSAGAHAALVGIGMRGIRERAKRR